MMISWNRNIEISWNRNIEISENLLNILIRNIWISVKTYRFETSEISESYLYLRAELSTIPPSLFFCLSLFSLGNPVGCHSLPAQSSFCLSICTGLPPPDIVLSPSKLVLIMLCFAPRQIPDSLGSGLWQWVDCVMSTSKQLNSSISVFISYFYLSSIISWFVWFILFISYFYLLLYLFHIFLISWNSGQISVILKDAKKGLKKGPGRPCRGLFKRVLGWFAVLAYFLLKSSWICKLMDLSYFS